MTELSYFESRHGKMTCNAADFFAFVTDMRNFEKFIPIGTIRDWSAEKESCSLSVPMLGSVTVRLIQKEKFNKVVFKGDALNGNDFTLILNITDDLKSPADVKVVLSADLNPMMKIMAAKPISKFLEAIINEMERFSGWNDTKE
jgi:hypothetical protein